MTIRLKPVFVEGRDIDDTWFQLLQQLHDHGRRYKIDSGSYAGSERVAFDFVSGYIHYPHTRPLAPRMPESSTLPPPTTDEEIEHYFATYLMDSSVEPNEDYRYSTWISGGYYHMPKFRYIKHNDAMYVTSFCIDACVPNQLEWIIKHFQEAGHGNEHCFLQVGYPESNLSYDIPFSNEQERRTSPCLRGLDFRIIDGTLTTHVIFRSWDIMGFPTNIGGFTLLNEYVAQEVGVDPGPLSFSCKSLHCYDHAFGYLRQRIGKLGKEV